MTKSLIVFIERQKTKSLSIIVLLTSLVQGFNGLPVFCEAVANGAAALKVFTGLRTPDRRERQPGGGIGALIWRFMPAEAQVAAQLRIDVAGVAGVDRYAEGFNRSANAAVSMRFACFDWR